MPRSDSDHDGGSTGAVELVDSRLRALAEAGATRAHMASAEVVRASVTTTHGLHRLFPAARRPHRSRILIGAWVGAIAALALVLAIAVPDLLHNGVQRPTSGLNSGKVTPSGKAPSPRQSGTAIAYFPPKHELVLFGGANVSTGKGLGDTWVFNEHGWTELHLSVSPQARGGSGMAYDPQLGEIVLYGGCTFCGAPGFKVISDTWAFNGTSWHKLSSSRSPSYVPALLMGWDSETRTFDVLAPAPGFCPDPDSGCSGDPPVGIWSLTSSGWSWKGVPPGAPDFEWFFAQSAFVSVPGTKKMLYFVYQKPEPSCPPGGCCSPSGRRCRSSGSPRSRTPRRFPRC